MTDTRERRNFPRFRVAGTEGDVYPIEGSVIDLSLRGASLEHEAVLRPGSTCKVTFRQSGGTTLSLPARVIRSRIGRVEKRGDKRILIYRSGIEFAEITAEQETILRHMLKRGRPSEL